MRTSLFKFLLLTLIFFACDEKQSSENIGDELRGNIFELKSSNFDQTKTIEFKESTYTIYEDGIQNLEWFDTIFPMNTLVLNGKKVKFQKANDSILSGKLVTESGKIIEIQLKKRKPNWSEKSLYGIWMTKRDFEIRKGNLESNENQTLIPIVEKPKDSDSSDFQPYPILIIENGKMTYKKYYSASESEFELIKTDRYLALKLENPKLIGASYFKIMSQKDSLIYVDFTNKIENSDDSTQIEFSKFIKIRLPTTYNANGVKG